CHADPLHLHSFPTRRSSDLLSKFALNSEQASHRLDVERMENQVKLSGGRRCKTCCILKPSPPVIPVLYSVNINKKAGRQSPGLRSEEHTSELQSRENLVCRL